MRSNYLARRLCISIVAKEISSSSSSSFISGNTEAMATYSYGPGTCGQALTQISHLCLMQLAYTNVSTCSQYLLLPPNQVRNLVATCREHERIDHFILLPSNAGSSSSSWVPDAILVEIFYCQQSSRLIYISWTL